MLEKSINQIYKNAKDNKEKEGDFQFVEQLKKDLEKEIGKDKNKLLAYKIGCSANTNDSIVATAFTVTTIIIACMAMLDKFVSQKTLVICAFIICVIVAVLGIWSNRVIQRNRMLLLILEQIEKDMENKI